MFGREDDGETTAPDAYLRSTQLRKNHETGSIPVGRVEIDRADEQRAGGPNNDRLDRLETVDVRPARIAWGAPVGDTT